MSRPRDGDGESDSTIRSSEEELPLLVEEEEEEEEEEERDTPQEEVTEGVQFDGVHSARLQRYVTTLCYVYIFVVNVGGYMQRAPQTALYENIICKNYYLLNSGDSVQAHGGPAPEWDCKIEPVQSELAVINGMQELFQGLIVIFCALPYGALANRWGRRLVLFLAVSGYCIGNAWVFVVCWFSDIFPLRLVWLSNVAGLIGGGSSVAATIMYLLVADAVPAKSRTNVYFRIHASSLVSIAVATPITSLLMTRSLWLPLLAGLTFLVCGSSISFLIPRSINKAQSPDKQIPTVVDDIASVNPSDTDFPPSPVIRKRGGTMDELIRSVRTIVSVPQAVLLLATMLLSSLGKGVTGLVMQYVSRRFHIAYSQANLFLTLLSVVNLALLVAILPLASSHLAARYGLPVHTKDIYLARGSALVILAGTVALGLAPTVGLAALGGVLFACGYGLPALVRSLVTSLVPARDQSVLHAMVSAMSDLGVSLSSPLYALVFTGALRLAPGHGDVWLGLPFLVVAAVFAAMTALLFAVKPLKVE